MTSDETGFLQQYLMDNLEEIWDRTNWIDICPYGEARFVGNVGIYPNDLTNSAWTATAVTASISTTIQNPADGRLTVSQLLETSATSAHKAIETVTVTGSTSYQAQCWVRAIGGRYLYLYANDGTTTFYSYFDLINGVTLTSGNLNTSAIISQQNNGFYLCQIAFTTGTTASSLTFGPQVSSDGTTLSYAGNTAKGLFIWGALLLQTSFANPASLTIPWDQTGENVIDALFEVWKNAPNTSTYPRRQGYELTPDGIQIVGPSGWSYGYYGYTPPQWYYGANPVFIYYRKTIPDYSGSAYSAASTYAVNDQILFTNSASVTNYWKCIVATSTGQSPDTTPASWSVVKINEPFFQYAVYAGFSSWLLQDGQFDKAEAMQNKAEGSLTTELDRQERQMGWIQPTIVSTHVTSQSRAF